MKRYVINKMRVRWCFVYVYMAVIVCFSFCAIDWCMYNLQEYQSRQDILKDRFFYRRNYRYMCYNKTTHSCERITNETADIAVDKTGNGSSGKKPFKFYIYNISPNLNENMTKCNFVQPFMCVDFQNQGFGSEIFRIGDNGDISIRDTSQFSLALIIHSKLKTNRLRTWNPDEADWFYLPVYFGLIQTCFQEINVREKFESLRQFLSSSHYLKQGKPHLSTLGLLYLWLPYDLYIEDHYRKITFLTMEAVHRPEDQEPLDEIVIPYPSYGHNFVSSKRTVDLNRFSSRNIFILLPIGNTWDRNSGRDNLARQFTFFTDLAYDKFIKEQENENFDMVLYYTNECSGNSTANTIPWMQNSVFCLQPRGDTDSRKSFFDSVMSGCIPVIMPQTQNPYPFQEFIDYEKIAVILPYSKYNFKEQNIYDILSNISTNQIVSLQLNLQRVAGYLQYSLPSGNREEENDALQLIFMAIAKRFNLPYDKTIHLKD